MALYDSKEETVQYEDPTRTVRVDMLSAFFEVCYKIFQNLLLRKAAGMCLEKLSHSRVPKPQKLHVNLDHGGLGDFGNCCLSVQRRNSLAVMALLWVSAVGRHPSDTHISVLFCLAALLVWEQFIWWLLMFCQGESEHFLCIHSLKYEELKSFDVLFFLHVHSTKCLTLYSEQNYFLEI